MAVDDRPKTPLGHPISSHQVHGWCLYCPGHTADEELAAWQVWAAAQPGIAEEVRRQQGG